MTTKLNAAATGSSFPSPIGHDEYDKEGNYAIPTCAVRKGPCLLRPGISPLRFRIRLGEISQCRMRIISERFFTADIRQLCHKMPQASQ